MKTPDIVPVTERRSLYLSSRWSEDIERAFKAICLLAMLLPLLLLLVLIGKALADGWPRLSWVFLTSYPSRRPEIAGLLPALVGSIYLMGLTALIAIPLGIGVAIYLEEYAPRGWLTSLIEINISNLAGVPSIIYDRRVNPVRLRQQVGMVFQKPNPFPTMSIRQNTLAGLQLQKIRPRDRRTEDYITGRFG